MNLKTQRRLRMLLYLIVAILIIYVIFAPLANFFVSVEEQKMDECEQVEENSGKKGEVYFECLQQNSLDSWNMNNRELYLKINFWATMIFGYLVGGLLALFIAVAYERKLFGRGW